MNIVLAADFGSTFTKVSAVDLDSASIAGTAKSFTTVETNVQEGFENALKALYAQCGKIDFVKKLASSSAAGGLKMISCGLVPDLTAKASKMAAASAGAKVLKTYAYELSQREQEEIFKLKPDIILLSGGIDGGNKEVILQNAKKLAEIDGHYSVIVAGNKTVSGEVSDILFKAGKKVIVTENVMPEFNKLNIEPAKNKIRELFIKNIVGAKGLDKVQTLMDSPIVPTPLAVYEACELLSKGSRNREGLGHLMAYDVGGATTDVYSMAPGEPTKPNVVLKGFLEPYAKRTVEGDIGVRYSIASLAEEAGVETLAENSGLAPRQITDWIDTCKRHPEILPAKDSIEKRIDEALAAWAVYISSVRHCGYFERFFTPAGETYLQNGKDLTQVKYIVGTGGSVINSENPKKLLEKALFQASDYHVLKPQNPALLLDRKNIFAAMGLVGALYPETALCIMKKEFVYL